jgi:hypothetical protein
MENYFLYTNEGNLHSRALRSKKRKEIPIEPGVLAADYIDGKLYWILAIDEWSGYLVRRVDLRRAADLDIPPFIQLRELLPIIHPSIIVTPKMLLDFEDILEILDDPLDYLYPWKGAAEEVMRIRRRLKTVWFDPDFLQERGL